jgi:hypothetical protein
MNRDKMVKTIVAVAILTMAVASFCFVESFDNNKGNTNTNTEGQILSAKDEESGSFLGKGLSDAPHEAYQKAKDFLASFFQKKSQDTYFASNSTASYFLHENISTTYFWVGEKGSEDNKNISNYPSCWDDKWKTHFGGVDDPKKRNGFFPSAFSPKENPFYFALPYNDFNSKGSRKSGLDAYIPWFKERKWKNNESACKNRWIKIIKGDKVAYAQWEDAGPFGEDDVKYVFGTDQPKSKANDNAGLDVSPAVRDFLGLSDVDKTNWQFVDTKDVPDGPWKKIVTNSNIYWN